MTGICGAFQVGGAPRSPIAPAALDAMLAVLAHRGPDRVAREVTEGVALAARVRAGDSDQPFANPDGTVRCVVDGELYEHGQGELAEIPELYRRYGKRFVEHVRGKFAIALSDAQGGGRVLVRDRLGMKPLYWAVADDVVVFASELKGVLASGLVASELDYEAIDAYLTLGYVPAPQTPLRGVAKLLPGSYLVVEGDGVRVERYWTFPKPKPDVHIDERELAERVLAALEECVRLHLRGEDEAAAVLSGGLDSSFVVALLARNTSKPVKTFTVGFAEAGEQNEIKHARSVSETVGAKHEVLELSNRDVVDLRQLSWHMDEPVADLSSLGLFALSGLVADDVRSVFSGQGSDQLFGGYRKHAAASIVGYAKRIPGAIPFARAVPERLIPNRLVRSVQTLAATDPATRLIAMSGRVSPDLRRRLVRGELAELDGRAAERAARSRLDGLSDEPLSAALYLDAQLELVDDMLHYFDRTTMAYALEVRMPFLDHRFVELTATIPAALKVKRLRNKHILRLAADRIVPARVVSDREKTKIGFFHSAVEGWLQAQMSGAVSDYLLNDRPACAEFIDQRELQAVVRHLASGNAQHTYGLFAILILEVWLSTYLPRALRPLSS